MSLTPVEPTVKKTKEKAKVHLMREPSHRDGEKGISVVSTGKASARLDKGGGVLSKAFVPPRSKIKVQVSKQAGKQEIESSCAPTTEPSSLSPPTRQIQLHLQQCSIAYNYYLMTLKKCI